MKGKVGTSTTGYELVVPHSVQFSLDCIIEPRSKDAAYEVVDHVVTLRQGYPAWSKYKLSVILKRDRDIELSASSGCGKTFFNELKEAMPFPVNAVQTDNGGEYLAKFECCPQRG